MRPVKTNRWRHALSKTRKTAFGHLATLLGTSDLTPHFWEQLEETLIQADLGVNTVIALVGELQDIARSNGLTDGEQVREELRRLFVSRLTSEPEKEPNARPYTIILVGVNGSGKTTTAARIARCWQDRGKNVLLAAADTYRAAAGEQLTIWGERLNAEVITGKPGTDPGAVVFDASQAALARQSDVLIVDTSGRMHTEHNLMAELKKICSVAGKVIPNAPHQVLLVLDATTGQNGLSQAKTFAEAVDVDGVVLAKLDSSAKGGIGFAIVDTLDLPIRYVGLGEGLDDLALFTPDAFVDGILAENGTPLAS
jgi:fused signal recognition particle receptor